MSERQSDCREGGREGGREHFHFQYKDQDICRNTQWKCNTISRMNGVNKVTVSFRQNDTSVFLVGDI